MKTFYIACVLLLINFSIDAQQLVESKDFFISFETPEPLEMYENVFPEFLGYENDNYAVDMVAFFAKEKAERYLQNIEGETLEFAKAMQFEDIADGGRIPHVDNAYFVIAQDEFEETEFPVYLTVIYNPEKDLVYEITVYCYSNSPECESITKSFKLLN